MTKEENEKFVLQGYFTVRRTDKFWTGVWSDMTIEQTLMRSMKCSGGLTRGRGITDTVLSKWVLGATATYDICRSLEDFCDLSLFAGEQHEDFREARIARDMADSSKLSAWLEHHPPFPEIDKIISLASGFIGDNTITCFNAFEIGNRTMNQMYGKRFSEVKLSRTDRARPLSSMSHSVKFCNTSITVDPLIIFQRISICKRSDEDLAYYLQHELAPYPLSLFNEFGMRKTKKSAIYKIFEQSGEQIDLQHQTVIVDGGFLLHKVVWKKGMKILDICNNYIKYIKRHYCGSSCSVVFDGYTNVSNSIKVAEQNRRYLIKMSVDINFDDNTMITVPQNQFLSNKTNKSKLIEMLSSKLNGEGVECFQSSNDADTLIVTTAIDKLTHNKNVTIVGEDVDLLVLITALTPRNKNIYFYKPGRGQIGTQVFSSQSQQRNGLTDIALLGHSFTGCDTTSSCFRKGKVAIFKRLMKLNSLASEASTFNCPHSSHQQVAEAGSRLFLNIYGAPDTTTSLNMHRFYVFTKSGSNMKPDLASLPPTEGAAIQHSYRVYLQIQMWLGNQISPEQWGWEYRHDQNLVPITTRDSVAPDEVLNLIFCQCATGCGNKCGCRRKGVTCTAACHNCHGNCLNVPPPGQEDIELEEEAEMDLNT